MKPPIQSLQNTTIKRIAKLRDASTRRTERKFLIDGDREIARAVAAGFDIEAVYFPDDGSSHSLACENALLAMGISSDLLQPVSLPVMRKLAYGDRESSVVAVAQIPSLELSRLRFSAQPLILVLDSIEKPGNLGACMRTAAATGTDAVVLTNPVCDVFNPNAIRASRGTMFSIPIAVAPPSAVLNLCQERGITVHTARVDGSTTLWQSDFRSPSAIVFGGEAHGLDNSWPSPPCISFRIPMHNSTDSLNVSISAALTLYESVRQRQSSKS